MISSVLRKKIIHLADILRTYDSLVVAFSGGVDSAFLLTIAKKILNNNLLAITAKSIIHFDHDLEDAKRLTKKLGINHIFFNSGEMYLSNFILNGKDRCYFCKKSMFDSVSLIAEKNGFANIAHGINTDDMNDYRPGHKAANEMGVLAPLNEANFSKKDIRCLARFYKIDVWDKLSTACVATRFPYGNRISAKSIDQVKKAELILFDAGFKLCRVRHHGDVARIEVDSSDIHTAATFKVRKKMVKALRKIGYAYVSLDLEGYVQGSMNRPILHG